MANIDKILDNIDWEVIDRVGLTYEQQVCCDAMRNMATQYLPKGEIGLFRTQLLTLSTLFGLRRLTINQEAHLKNADIEVL